MRSDKAGGMTLTGWAGLAVLGLGEAVVTVSHVSCEVRGREGCLRQTAEPVVALLAGSGLLFTHSPAEGAMAAMRGRWSSH